jgi:hypothetical protein
LGTIRMKDESAEGIGPGRLTSAVLLFCLATYCLFGAMGYRLDRIMAAIAPPYHAELLIGGGGGGAKEASNVVEDDYEGALARALKENKWLLVNFTGDT